MYRWLDFLILIATQTSVSMSHKNRIIISPLDDFYFPRCISQIQALMLGFKTCPYSIMIFQHLDSQSYNYMKMHKH